MLCDSEVDLLSAVEDSISNNVREILGSGDKVPRPGLAKDRLSARPEQALPSIETQKAAQLPPLSPLPAAPLPAGPLPAAPLSAAALSPAPLSTAPAPLPTALPTPPLPSAPPAREAVRPQNTRPMYAELQPAPPYDSMGTLLRRQVRIIDALVPAWAIGVLGVLIAVLVGAASMRAFNPQKSESRAVEFGPALPEAPAETPAKAPPHAAQPTESAAAPANRQEPKKELTPLQRAAAGDAKALETLKRTPASERTAAQLIAIARGDNAQALSDLQKLTQDLKASENAPGGEALKPLLARLKDPELSREAVAALAELPGARPADAIYEAWVGTRARTPTTELAEALLYTEELLEKASPALRIALKLRQAETCDEYAELLPSAEKNADRRSVRLLSRVYRNWKCSTKVRIAARDAMLSARRRRAPKF